MRRQFRASSGQIIHLQTTSDVTHLAVKIPGADPIQLTADDIARLVDDLTEGRHEIARKLPPR